jgi:2-oxoisovalerate dehydrogenase E1 component
MLQTSLNLEKLDNPELAGKGGVFKVTSGCQRVSKEGQVLTHH